MYCGAQNNREERDTFFFNNDDEERKTRGCEEERETNVTLPRVSR